MIFGVMENTIDMECIKVFLFITALLVSNFSFAAPYYGITLSGSLYATEPVDLRGFQLMLKYDPDRFKWQQFNIYFDGGFSYFRATDYPCHKTVNIYSVAPVIRYTLNRYGLLLPYWEISIGLAYLNHTRIAHRNLGIHFAFQDRAGIGTWIGESKKFSLGLHVVHYSNGHLCNRNSGITLPLVLDLSYWF
jgi:lipid A 3-O-deacylase